jgi:hypothetical protein
LSRYRRVSGISSAATAGRGTVGREVVGVATATQ